MVLKMKFLIWNQRHLEGLMVEHKFLCASQIDKKRRKKKETYLPLHKLIPVIVGKRPRKSLENET